MQENKDPNFDDTPRGFDLGRDEGGSILISYRFRGMQGMVFFLVLWFTFWSIGGYWAFQKPINDFMILWLSMWTVGEVTVAYMLMWIFFGKTVFKIGDSTLTIQKRLFFYSGFSVIKKSDVKEVFQVKDGGEGEDSFPSWGLKLTEKKTHYLLRRQERLKSVWLGSILGKWAGVDFKPHSKP